MDTEEPGGLQSMGSQSFSRTRLQRLSVRVSNFQVVLKMKKILLCKLASFALFPPNFLIMVKHTDNLPS